MEFIYIEWPWWAVKMEQKKRRRMKNDGKRSGTLGSLCPREMKGRQEEVWKWEQKGRQEEVRIKAERKTKRSMRIKYENKIRNEDKKKYDHESRILRLNRPLKFRSFSTEKKCEHESRVLRLNGPFSPPKRKTYSRQQVIFPSKKYDHESRIFRLNGSFSSEAKEFFAATGHFAYLLFCFFFLLKFICKSRKNLNKFLYFENL